MTLLKKGSLKCPTDKTLLHFENHCGMRIIKDGYLNAYCPKCKKYFNVKPNE